MLCIFNPNLKQRSLWTLLKFWSLKNETEIPIREALMTRTVFCSILYIYQVFYSPSSYWPKRSGPVEMAQKGQAVPSMPSSALESDLGCPFLFCCIPVSHFSQLVRSSLTAGRPQVSVAIAFPHHPPASLSLGPHKGIRLPFVLAKGPHGYRPWSSTTYMHFSVLCLYLWKITFLWNASNFQPVPLLFPSCGKQHKSLSSSSPTLHISQHGDSNPGNRESICLTEPRSAPQEFPRVSEASRTQACGVSGE